LLALQPQALVSLAQVQAALGVVARVVVQVRVLPPADSLVQVLVVRA
jgi:hypothetical protein